MSTNDSDGSKPDVECPWEGCDYSSNENGVKIHHKRTHGESIAGVVFECAWCGKTRRRKKALVERAGHSFCGEECQGAFYSEHHTGESANNWQGGWVEVECAWCGDAKQVEAYRPENTGRFFCGDDGSCRAAWRAENWVGENATNWKGGLVEVECIHCGETREMKPSAADMSDYHICTECKGSYYSERYSGENAHNWRGGFDYNYGHMWAAARDAALERDDHRCVVCGRSEAELGQAPDVHHIVPKRHFDSLRAAHQLGNLIALCREHHIAAEAGSVETPTPNSPLTPQAHGD